METKMFCFQCQEAAKGTGCTHKGVCGKDDKTANRMDLLLFVTKGIATVATLLHNAGIESSMKVNHFTTDALRHPLAERTDHLRSERHGCLC